MTVARVEPFIAVRTTAELARGLGIPEDWGLPPDSFLDSLPAIVGEDVASSSPTGPVRFQEAYQSALPRMYVKVSRLKPNFVDLIIAAAAIVMPGRELDTAIALLNKVRQALTLLTEEQEEVVRVIAADSPGNPYRDRYSRERLRRSFEGGEIDLERVIEELVRRDVISVSESGILLVF